MANLYLSATYQDLKPHRDAVYRILRMLRHDVIAMEDYVATDAYPLHKCLADVAACDIYIGMIGWRYGYRPDKDNPDGKSITELEYRQAVQSGKPRLLFLTDPTADWPDAFKDSHTGENDNGARIDAFRGELEKGLLVGHFRSPDHLAKLVSVAVTCHLQNHPTAGSKPFPRLAAIKLKALNERLEALLADFEALSRHISFTNDPVDRERSARRLTALRQELEKLELERDSLV